jgi:hypothetical protein
VRGTDDKQASMFSVVSPERRIAPDHPLRRIKAMADEVLGNLSSTFDAMYSKTGRPSIPPERLLKSQILMALYSVRSDRQFCEQLDYNLLFRIRCTERTLRSAAGTTNVPMCRSLVMIRRGASPPIYAERESAAVARSSGSGTSNADSGASSSSARSRARVARQSFGASSR